MNTQGYGINRWLPPDQPTADEFDQFSIDLPLTYYSGLFDALKANCGSKLQDDDGTELPSLLMSRVQSMTPTSLIRISDGEGNVLFGTSLKYEHLKRYVLQKISVMHFGSKSIIFDNYDQFALAMAASIDSADVIGIPGIGTITGGFGTSSEKIDVRSLVGNRYSVYVLGRLALNKRMSGKTLASVWFSRHLLSQYMKILAAAQRICVVACYPELVSLIRSRVGRREITFIQVPPQAKQSQNKGVDSKHYPEHFARICAQIMEQRPGTVYLVAAGLLGKYYCHLAKVNDGISIDIGSVADIWMGQKSRPGITDAFVDKWALLNRDAPPAAG